MIDVLPISPKLLKNQVEKFQFNTWRVILGKIRKKGGGGEREAKGNRKGKTFDSFLIERRY